MSKHENDKNLTSKNYSIRPEDNGISDQINSEFAQAHDHVEVAVAHDPRLPRPDGDIWDKPLPMTPARQTSIEARAEAALQNMLKGR